MEAIRTLPRSWQTPLHLLLGRLKAETGRLPRLAVVGIGNELRSDDAAGMLVARALSERPAMAEADRLLVLAAGQAPENATGALRRFAPDLLLLVDAAEMGDAPGAIRWIEMKDISGMSASTHSLPLSMLAKYLFLELRCEVVLLGIQPASNEFKERASPAVLRAVGAVAGGVEEAFRS